jgi:hypothetical protein
MDDRLAAASNEQRDEPTEGTEWFVAGQHLDGGSRGIVLLIYETVTAGFRCSESLYGSGRSGGLTALWGWERFSRCWVLARYRKCPCTAKLFNVE